MMDRSNEHVIGSQIQVSRRLAWDALRAHEEAVTALLRSRRLATAAIEVLALSEEGGGSSSRDEALGFLGELFGRQNELASTEECERRYFEELELAFEIEDPDELGRRVALAGDRYRACLNRRRPIFVVPEEPR